MSKSHDTGLFYDLILLILELSSAKSKSYFKKAINQIINKSNIHGLYKDMVENNKLLELNDEEKNKIKLLEEEKNKIMEKYIPIKDEYDMSR